MFGIERKDHMAATGSVCLFCERDIKAKQSSIECSTCGAWVHKSCSGLGKSEYDRVVAEFRKKKSHKWECKTCQSSEIRRLSAVFGHASVTDGSGDIAGATDEDSAEECEADIVGRVNNLLKKPNISNKDILSVVSYIVNLLVEQKSSLQGALADLKEREKIRDQKIGLLEGELAQLRADFVQLKDSSPSVSGTAPQLVIDEVEERKRRAINVMIYNVPESVSDDPKARIEHDASLVDTAFQNVVEGIKFTKVLRVGKRSEKVRPIKVIMHDERSAQTILSNKSRFREQGTTIGPDQTLWQRHQFKELRSQLQQRTHNGETKLGIKYFGGVPKIVHMDEPRQDSMRQRKNLIGAGRT